ncbi:unnamed protein product (macronuclear) [Paramecium tetraurelia]|uniref:Transmembrane protein n=1 Tax=Paramecium tetraurelia TaxID=5888 RepID=A0BYC0_PARTE|nr:uncharacterized protein GSPATT00033390001 [Paramecium tetraurelia]CAK63537.1 unnamed protein product [Paramecium tetraurelia]|eukprot:XP_001430935.1 hypothetical protein (macronuclear) [Paramecium tetraurelia strain d4-2]
MHNFLVTFLLGLYHKNFVLSFYFEALNEQQQYYAFTINTGGVDFAKLDYFNYGIWSKYLPLSIISQVGLIGMFDSHCYLLSSISEYTNLQINLLYYDCVDQSTNTVYKKVQFLGSDNQIYTYKFEIDPLIYENYWYFFCLNLIPSEGIIDVYIFQRETTIAIQQHVIKGIFKDSDLKFVIGGGLVVEESQQLWNQDISTLSYFPGKLSILHPNVGNQLVNEIGFETFLSFSNDYHPECTQVDNSEQSLQDFDIFKLNQEVFASENRNCDGFSLEAWIRISDFRQEDQQFIYQLIKISANFENNYAKNENLSAFQLFYEFSNSQIKLLVTTYSYTLPLVDYDFEKSGFLLSKDWSINNIKLWHFLYVSLDQNILKVSITFFQGLEQTLHETQFQVNHFHEVQFKLQYGNLLQSATNYLTGALKNLRFSNAASDDNIITGCHYSCQECEGPTYKDCLSCSEESKRVYLEQYKVCVCPNNYIDEQECKGMESYNLFLNSGFEQDSTSNCRQGYFNQDQFCLKCPSLIKDSLMTCLECIQNPKGWHNDPYCQTNLYIDDLGSPAQYKVDKFKTYYIFDGMEIKPSQKDFIEDQDQIERIYQDFEITNKNFLILYSYYSSDLDFYPCTLQNCLICQMLLTKQICIKCSRVAKLKDGVCVITPRGIRQINDCNAPYYITSEKGCNLCQIENCQFCFEYESNDLTKCTLYNDFQAFKIDEFHKIGCALCLDGFIFDFTQSKCIYKEPTLTNCLRSFINQSGQELCTLSAIQDFKVAPEIINCQKYISKCKQCIQTPQSIVKCIVCEDGYSSSLTTGFCTICELQYSKLCIEGDYTNLDAWMQLIQSFLMQFLPNKYLYPQSTDILYISPIAIKCIDQYSLNQNFCRKYCDSNCATCQKETNAADGFTCGKCTQSYYMEPLRTIEKGLCITCSLLCQVCQERTIEEIKNLNPAFVINDSNKKYTYKCVQQTKEKNIMIDPYQQVAKYCFDGICDNIISYQIKYNCLEIFDELERFLEQFNFEYFNQIGAQRFNLIILIQDLCPIRFTYLLKILNQLQARVISLQWTEMILQGDDLPTTFPSGILFQDFDSINLNHLLYFVMESLEIYIHNTYYPTNIKLTDSTFFASNQDSIYMTVQTEKCQHFEIRNITLSDLNILNSIAFQIRFQDEVSFIKIQDLTIRNCNFSQTIIFQFYSLPKNSFIQNLTIENCQFINSTIFDFKQDSNTQSIININDFKIRNSLIQNSQLINGTDTYYIDLAEVTFISNKFENSKFLVFQNSLIIKQLKLEDCNLNQTFLFYKLISTATLLIDQFDIQNNVLVNTSLIFTTQQTTLNQGEVKLYNINFLENGISNAQNSSAYLFHINCFSLEIKKFEIINSFHLQYFILQSVTQISVEDLSYANKIQRYQVPASIECLQVTLKNSQLFYISGYSSLSLTNIEIINQYSVDQSFIQILSNSSVTNQRENIKLKGLKFIGNILVKRNLGLVLSQLTIYSEKIQIIEMENIQFQDNSFNQLFDDPSQTTSSLLLINSQSSSLYINHLTSQNNALTNSTNPFIYINTNSIKINNIGINNHNQLNSSFWNKNYNLDLKEKFNQDIINHLINKAFTIQNKGGALVIVTEQFIINNCVFKEILAQSSSILDVVTQGLGKVTITNCQIESSQNIFSQIGDNDGAISIYSKNSLLELEFKNVNFKDIQNRLASSILSLIPSLKSNLITFQNIAIQNCFSLINQFMKIEFQLLTLKTNIVTLKNISIFQDENQLVQYFQKMESLSIYDIQKISNDNAIINIQGCSLNIQSLKFSGILLSSLLKVLDSQTLHVSNLLVLNAKSFYPINMVHIGQTISISYQVVLQDIKILNMASFDFSKLNTNIIEYSKISLDYNNCNINLQLLNQVFTAPTQVAWIFEQILHQSSETGALIHIQTQLLISNNQCLQCWNGIIQFDLTQYYSIKIVEAYCLKNNIRNYGCIFAKSSTQQETKLVIKNSLFMMNNGTIGSAIATENVRITLVNSKFLKNIATQQGGALYLSLNNNEFKIAQTIIYNNQASQGGGIYLHGNSNLNSENFINSWMKLNSASQIPNNLQEKPTHLTLSINNFEMNTIEKKINNIIVNSLYLQPYRVMEQGRVQQTRILMIPSNQEIIRYNIYNPSLLKFDQYIDEFSIAYKNSLNEILPNFSNASCKISRQTLQNNVLIDSTNITTVEYNSEFKSFDLSFLSITADPYQLNNYTNQIQISCHLNDQTDDLLYNIEIKGFKCQLGEFYVQSGCQICQPSQGYYSVTYNTTKCSIFDQNKFKSVTSNQIELKQGYWRPDYQSDYIEYCFKFVNFCEGGWVVSDHLCVVGHIGGLCEECDIYDIRGHGNYFKNLINMTCQDCTDAVNSVLPFIATTIWALISTLLTLRSIDTSNKLFSSLKVRQKYVKIIFKLNQDHESILLKLFLNYQYLLLICEFSFSFTFINQTNNTSFFMANNLDCYLSEIYNIHLIYSRMITMIVLMIAQLLIIYMGFKLYSTIKKRKFNSSLISTALLYLYVQNYAALIKQFFSLLAKRVISNIEYISGDVSLLFNSTNHKNWMFGFALPGLGLIGCLIPSALFLLLYIQREKLDKINFRKHICYLFNEYNNETYFWEWIKLWKKTVIILIMTYFETNIFVKASLLGLCLLLYQLYAVKQKPYIIKNLNQLDVSTGQICSIAIFLASIKYISEQQENKIASVMIEMLLIILCLKLTYPFVIDLLRVYYKKYKIPFISNLHKALQLLNCNQNLTLYVNRKLIQMKQREKKLKTNLIKLRIHLIQISKFQLESQKSLLNLLNSQSTSRQTLLGLDQNVQKIIRLEAN